MTAFNFEEIAEKIDTFVWGWFLIVLVLFAGIYLTVKSKGVQIFHLREAFRCTFKTETDGKGEISAFGSLCTTLSATIGTGNIVGVATAVTTGGPGALFWMLISAFFGMATKYSEGLLAVKYRRIDSSGRPLGGPFYYIEKGIPEKIKGNFVWLGKIFALFGSVAGVMGIGTSTQMNGICDAVNRITDTKVLFLVGNKPITLASVISAGIITVVSAAIIFGGVKRIAKVSSVLVPFMSFLFFFFSLVIFLSNLEKVPQAVSLIVRSAFSPKAAGGAFIGVTLKETMQKGIGRGIFSNEAGIGSAPIAAAAAKTKEPVKQGLVLMLGTFIDTIVLCTVTGLTIIITDAHTLNSLQGFDVTAVAWQRGLPLIGNMSVIVLSVCLILFAFSTIIGWNYYSESCLEYLIGRKNRKAVTVFRVLYILSAATGPFLTVETVWSVAGISNGLMAIPNLFALIILSDVVARETKNYFKKQK